MEIHGVTPPISTDSIRSMAAFFIALPWTDWWHAVLSYLPLPEELDAMFWSHDYIPEAQGRPHESSPSWQNHCALGCTSAADMRRQGCPNRGEDGIARRLPERVACEQHTHLAHGRRRAKRPHLIGASPRWKRQCHELREKRDAKPRVDEADERLE